MSSALLHPPAHLPPHRALHLSQQAPLLLRNQTDTITSLQVPLLSSAETPERWMIYENLMLSCLRTGDDKSAHLCLQRLSDRFGPTNERVMGLRGMYQEAVAEDEAALEHVQVEYEKILDEDPTNTVRLPCYPSTAADILLIVPQANLKAAYSPPAVYLEAC